MNIDFSKIVSELGDNLIGKAGEPVGLNEDQSVRVARSLAAHFGKGSEEAVKAAAEDTGLSTEVVSSMLQKLIEVGKEKLMGDAGVTAAVDNARDQAMAALQGQGGELAKNAGGFLGKLFGKK